MVQYGQPVVSGVYFLFADGALKYVGRSRDCYRRVDAHRANGREFDYAAVMPCPSADLGWIEAALIRAFRPPANSNGSGAGRKEPEPVDVAPPPPAPLWYARPAPAPVEWADTDLMSKAEALGYAAERRLRPALVDAMASGEVVFAPMGRPRRNNRGEVYHRVFVAHGVLRSWCESQTAGLLAAAGFTPDGTGYAREAAG